VVEGRKVVDELIHSGFPLVELYATDAWRPTQPIGIISAVAVSPVEMERISHFPTPSEVLAVGRIARPALTAGLLERGLTLALDGVQDAGNVGTILRIADWFGFERVLLSPDCADVFSQKVINASMGSFARLPTFTAELAAVLAPVKAPILGCDLAGDDVHKVGTLRDAVIVIGNEGHGLSPAVAARVTRRVTIPRLGRAESLNAAVAAAIVCDNLRRS
jgi:TrmH family RNA methyltransferase